jgi:hypothetical protein
MMGNLPPIPHYKIHLILNSLWSLLKGRKMTQITLEVPDVLANLPEQERSLLIRAGLYEATRAWIRQLEAEIAESKAQIQHFEARYNLSFLQFEAERLPTLDTLQAHEDYNDWFYWQSVLTEKQRLLAELQPFEPN